LNFTINCSGRLINFDNPKVMGILNLTPDSFFDGGIWKDENYLFHVEKMLEDGAEIIDVGGMSSRPGAEFISEEEEINRVLEPIYQIKKRFPEAIISVDTWRAAVLERAFDKGADIANDISGGSFDATLLSMVAKLQMPYILMHIKEKPKTMQENPVYQNIGLEVLDYFIQKIELLKNHEIKDIILDPGFGFGKTLSHNFELLSSLRYFELLSFPILVGISRKSMIYNLLKISAEDALNGTTVAHTLALENGAKIIRAHDVKEAVQTIKIWEFYKKEQHNTTICK
jgi:dihydropteroate synthase